MQKRTLTALALAAGLAGGFSGIVGAQTPPTPPAHHGILGRLFHPHGQPRMAPGMHPGMAPGRPGGMSLMGNIIGNKNSHVYHMPGDKGSLPSAANRVYFRTEAQAMAAGYHRAGASHGRTGGAMHGHHVTH